MYVIQCVCICSDAYKNTQSKNSQTHVRTHANPSAHTWSLSQTHSVATVVDGRLSIQDMATNTVCVCSACVFICAQFAKDRLQIGQTQRRTLCTSYAHELTITMHAHVHTHQNWHTHTRTHTHTRARTHMHTLIVKDTDSLWHHAHNHKHTNAHTHTHARSRAHTHMRSFSLSRSRTHSCLILLISLLRTTKWMANILVGSLSCLLDPSPVFHPCTQDHRCVCVYLSPPNTVSLSLSLSPLMWMCGVCVSVYLRIHVYICIYICIYEYVRIDTYTVYIGCIYTCIDLHI